MTEGRVRGREGGREEERQREEGMNEGGRKYEGTKVGRNNDKDRVFYAGVDRAAGYSGILA